MKLKVLTLDGLSAFKSILLSLFTKEQIGLSNVENKSSEEIRNEITYTNIIGALGYVPASTAMEVPMVSINVDIPKWMQALPSDNKIISEIIDNVKNASKNVEKMCDFSGKIFL